MANKFRRLEVRHWRQFEDVTIDFHPRLTVLTGTNGSGKTALLRILALHFRWSFAEPAVPEVNTDTGRITFVPPVRNETRPSLPVGRVGIVSYTDGQEMPIVIRVPHGGTTYSIEGIPVHQLNVSGVFLPSHRLEFMYHPVSSVPTTPPALSPGIDSLSNFLMGGHGPNAARWNSLIKGDLVAWAMHSYDTGVVVGDPDMRHNFEAFQAVARILLPEALGFQSFKVHRGEVLLVTKTGEFSLDAVSGGIASLLEIGWLLLFSSLRQSGQIVVVIDEVENHLHPGMQRELLPNLLKAFPEAQFIVSTHSPLVVGSVRDSTVVALRHNEQGFVESIELDFMDRAGTASDILRDVLGVRVTLPVWAEQQLEALAARYAGSEPTMETFQAIRAELARDGLEEFAPEAIAGVVTRRPTQT